MRVTVRLFAGARELVGNGTLEQVLGAGATVQDLSDRLFERYPGLCDMRLRFAVNTRYASMDTVLHEGDQIACIPPVGGG